MEIIKKSNIVSLGNDELFIICRGLADFMKSAKSEPAKQKALELLLEFEPLIGKSLLKMLLKGREL